MSPASPERTCPDCGAAVDPAAVKCPSCQAVLSAPDDEEPVEVQAVTAEPARRKPAPRRRDEEDDEDDYEDDDRPRRKYKKEEAVEATDFLVPTNVSGWALASCYMGLLGVCIPIAGLLLTIPAFIFGIIALRRQRRASTYGAVTGNARAVIGIVLSILGFVISALALVGLLMSRR